MPWQAITKNLRFTFNQKFHWFDVQLAKFNEFGCISGPFWFNSKVRLFSGKFGLANLFMTRAFWISRQFCTQFYSNCINFFIFLRTSENMNILYNNTLQFPDILPSIRMTFYPFLKWQTFIILQILISIFLSYFITKKR